MSRKLFLVIVSLILVCNAQKPFLTPKFDRLTLGEILPQGWLKDILNIQAEGLAGHLQEFWPSIENSSWIGGSAPPDGENERVPYWLNGMVPLAALTKNPSIVSGVNDYLQYIIKHQNSNGWFTAAGDPWPTFPLLLAFTQQAESDPENSKMYIQSSLQLLNYLYGYLQNNKLSSWAQYRWQDLGLVLQWLSRNTDGNDEFLGKFFDLISQQGFDWAGFYRSPQFPRDACTGKCPSLATHGVNNGQALKSGAVQFWRDNNPTHAAEFNSRLELLDTYHGQSTGMFSCSEHLAGKNPSQGYELCTTVETMFSLSTVFSAWGNISHADRLETITFNALPGSLDSYMWDHIYLSQSNHIHSGHISPNIWTTDGPDSNIYGLEPNFGCCTANFPQGWPKFTSGIFMRSTADNGLVVASFVPCTVNTKLSDGTNVNIAVDTEYPFSEDITITVTSTRSFPLYIRIPQWVNNDAQSWIIVGNSQKQSVVPGNFKVMTVGGSPNPVQISVHLDMPVKIEQGVNNAAILKRGPLLLALKIGSKWTELHHYKFNSSDWQIDSTTNWNYALNLSSHVEIQRRPISPVPFSPWGCPLSATIQGRILNSWGIVNNTAAPPPTSPVTSESPLETLTLLPFGCTDLRISQFPVLKN